MVRRFKDHLAVRVHAFHHFEISELRHEFRNRVIQAESALLVERHQGDTRDRLGHGIDTEDRIFLDRGLIRCAPNAMLVIIHCRGHGRVQGSKARLCEPLAGGRRFKGVKRLVSRSRRRCGLWRHGSWGW